MMVVVFQWVIVSHKSGKKEINRLKDLPQVTQLVTVPVRPGRLQSLGSSPDHHIEASSVPLFSLGPLGHQGEGLD